MSKPDRAFVVVLRDPFGPEGEEPLDRERRQESVRRNMIGLCQGGIEVSEVPLTELEVFLACPERRALFFAEHDKLLLEDVARWLRGLGFTVSKVLADSLLDGTWRRELEERDLRAASESVAPSVAPDDERCRLACPHGSRCRLVAGHEKQGWGCSHLAFPDGCPCNLPNLPLEEALKPRPEVDPLKYWRWTCACGATFALSSPPPSRPICGSCPSTAMGGPVQVHRHRCMGCSEEVDCVSPSTCRAGYHVLPRRALQDPMTGAVRFDDHCTQESRARAAARG